MSDANELFEQNQEWAHFIAKRVMARHSVAENRRLDEGEVEQAALIALWQAAEKYKPSEETPFRFYAYWPVFRACVEVYGKIDLPVTRPLHEASEIELGAVPDDEAFEEYLEGLSEQQKHLMRLRYRHGLSLNECAARLRVIPRTARIWHEQAMAIVRRHTEGAE